LHKQTVHQYDEKCLRMANNNAMINVQRNPAGSEQGRLAGGTWTAGARYWRFVPWRPWAQQGSTRGANRRETWLANTMKHPRCKGWLKIYLSINCCSGACSAVAAWAEASLQISLRPLN
jgi:hypothetical protein